MSVFNQEREDEYSKDVQHLIDIFNPPPPKHEYIPPPDFRMFDHPEKEMLRYYEREMERYNEGFKNEMGEFVPPNHYFHLQNSTLEDIYGNIFKPKWRDTDELMALWSLDSIKNGTSELVYKRREIGATTFYANQGFWIWRTNEGSNCAFTSGNGQSGISAMFNDKILLTYNNFDKKVLNTTPVRINNSKTATSLSVPLRITNEYGRVEDRISELIAKETSENKESVTNISGKRALYVYVDEAPLHGRLDGFLGSIFPVINKGPKRTGLLVMAGTVEPRLTSEQLSNFKKLIDENEDLKLKTRFLPVWMGMFTKNGWSNKEAGLQWYEEQVIQKQDSGNYVSARNFKMQYPKDEQDIFDLNEGGTFDLESVEILRNRGNELQKRSNEEAQYKLVATSTGFEMIPDTKRRDPEKEGGFWMIEPPKENLDYYIAIDSIGSAKKDGGDKGSWIASVVFKGHDPNGRHFEPVCIYFERPQTIEAGYKNIVNQFRYFNKFDRVKEINYETNAATGDHFGTFLEKEDLYKKYAAKRKDLSGKGWTNTKKRGTPVNEYTRIWQIAQANRFIHKHGMHIRSLMVIKQLLLPSEKNADIRDAFLVFMASIPNFDKPIAKKSELGYRTEIQLTTNEHGQRIYKQVKIPIIDPNAVLDETPEDAFTKFDTELKQRYGAYGYQKANGEEREKYNRLKALCGHADQIDS